MNIKRSIMLLLILLAIIVIGFIFMLRHKDEVEYSKDIEVIPTMLDTLKQDSAWCATFGLVWNDMKNEVVKQDVVFNPQIDMAANLNKEPFKEDMLSSDYYYKIYGLKTLRLKKEIEDGIYEKFKQKSDILEDFDWSNSGLNDPNNPNIKRYFFYTMLYRKFEFLKQFEKLDNDSFGKYSDVKYFGTTANSSEEVRSQIDVLYYKSKDDFAILVNTKENDEVIFYKNPDGKTFEEMYKNMLKKASLYKGSTIFESIDYFKAPVLNINLKREYTEFENKEFLTLDNDVATIDKAIQTIKFTLDEKGGEVKSEAAIDIKVATAKIDNDNKTPRYFYVDDTFALFLKEKDKKVPYLALRVNDITKFS